MLNVSMVATACTIIGLLLLVLLVTRRPKDSDYSSQNGKVIRCPDCGCLMGITKLG